MAEIVGIADIKPIQTDEVVYRFRPSVLGGQM